MRELEELGPWYHTVTVDGYTTPGKVDPTVRANLALGQLPDRLDGVTVLDIGGNCGGVSFEFAKRGASCTVLEVGLRFTRQGQALARLLDLDVRFERGVVYDAGGYGRFDVVLFFGLIYHLRRPFHALDVVRSACRDWCFLSSRLNASTSPVWSMGSIRGHVPGPDEEAAYNWWLPSLSVMPATMEIYGFSDVRQLQHDVDRAEAFWSGRVTS